jgi:hypothetical protein
MKIWFLTKRSKRMTLFVKGNQLVSGTTRACQMPPNASRTLMVPADAATAFVDWDPKQIQ